jgi:hypothetical protein
MNAIKTKKSEFKKLKILNDEINKLLDESSLATLDHKLDLRQKLLEFIFDNYKNEFEDTDIVFLKNIKMDNSAMLKIMEKNKKSKSDTIISTKIRSKRVKLYTIIAQQK